MGGLGLLLHRADHAIGEASRAADVGVGVDVDALVLEGVGVEGAAVVDHVQREVGGDVLGAPEHLALDELDVGHDEVLLAEGRRGDRELDRPQQVLLHLGVPVGLAHERLSRRVDLEGEQRRVALRKAVVDGLEVLELEGGAVEHLAPGLAERLVVADVGDVEGALRHDGQDDVADVGVAMPLDVGERVDVGREVVAQARRVGEDLGPLALGSLAARRLHVELGMLLRAGAVVEKDVAEAYVFKHGLPPRIPVCVDVLRV